MIRLSKRKVPRVTIINVITSRIITEVTSFILLYYGVRDNSIGERIIGAMLTTHFAMQIVYGLRLCY